MRLIKADGCREWLSLAQYGIQLEPEDWQAVVWPAQQEGQKWHAHIIKIWVRKLGPTLVMIICQDPARPQKSIRYWGSTTLDLDVQSFIDILAIRWNIETFLEYDKDLLGSDHYLLMSAEAILRF